MSRTGLPATRHDGAMTCSSCERCTWNPGPDCGLDDHEHCPMCGHCQGRHEEPFGVSGEGNFTLTYETVDGELPIHPPQPKPVWTPEGWFLRS